MADNKFMKELVAFAQEKGYVWGPSPEIYGGLAGFYTYGPLGKLLKNNVEDSMRKVFNKFDFWEVESPIVQPANVWKASGHLGNFTDPLIKAEDNNIYRADNLIEEFFKNKSEDPAKILAGKNNPEGYLEIIKKYNIMAPNGKKLIPEIKEHNLMMQTTIGLGHEAYNRPETATTTYLPFPRYFDFFRKKLPFGVFQIGKAFRNEVSPRQFIMRMREFTQAEAQLFIFEDQKNNFKPYNKIAKQKMPFWSETLQKSDKNTEFISVAEARKKGYLKNDAYAYTLAVAYNLFKSIGVPEESMRLRQHESDEKAFYADDAWDVEVKLKSFGWSEICGVHDRTTYDLKQHSEHSGKNLGVSDETHKKEIPHVLEIAFGTDRSTFVLLDQLFNPQDIEKGKTTFHILPVIAPIKVAVFPLVKKDGMPELAKEIYDELTKEFVCTYDQAGTVGRRYLRAAEQGTPYCLTVDGQTKEDNTITIRNRDTEEQKRIPKDEVSNIIHMLLTGKKSFEEL